MRRARNTSKAVCPSSSRRRHHGKLALAVPPGAEHGSCRAGTAGLHALLSTRPTSPPGSAAITRRRACNFRQPPAPRGEREARALIRVGRRAAATAWLAVAPCGGRRWRCNELVSPAPQGRRFGSVPRSWRSAHCSTGAVPAERAWPPCITLRQQAWPWRMTTASNAAEQAHGTNCGPASRAWCFLETATVSCALPAPGRHGLGRIRDLTVTSLVTSQHQRHADLRESRIWILTSCAPGKRLPPGSQQGGELRKQHSDREAAMRVPGRAASRRPVLTDDMGRRLPTRKAANRHPLQADARFPPGPPRNAGRPRLRRLTPPQ